MVSSPVALRIMAVETPHPTDPSDADLFYAALGRFTVAWGRFEGHFTGAILALHNLQGYAYASTTPIPMSWKRRAATWRKGFNELVELAPLRPRAMTYIERVMNEVNGRHIGAHAIWDTFTVPAAEPTMKARLISAKRDHPGMIDVADYELLAIRLGDPFVHSSARRGRAGRGPQRGDCAGGISLLERSIGIEKARGTYRNLGLALQIEGRLDDAVAAYRSACDIEPQNPEARLELGSMLLQAGRPVETCGVTRDRRH
jgi:hypothetical protein